MDLQTNKKEFKGLTAFDIKLLALVFMLLDHIHYFFQFTGKVPLLFSWIGRLAGHLFLFTMVEGYTHTSNRKKYFLRIYIMSVFMAIIKALMEIFPALQRGDGFYAENSILSTFVVLIVIFKGIDYMREKKYLKGIGLVLSPFIANYVVMIICQLFVPILSMDIANNIHQIATSFIPSPFMVEGGLFLIIVGIILYAFRGKRKVKFLLFGIFALAWMIGIPLAFLRPISIKLFFTNYYEWMGVFAVIFMFMYNGEKGKSMKKLFYIFYPAHVYILYGLSILLYNLRY